MVDIVPFNAKNMITAKSNREIKYIVIHYTAGTTSRPGKAKDVCIDWTGRPPGK
jgi:hypothetical protein